MRKADIRKIALVAISTIAVSLSGCLSKEDSGTDSSIVGDTPQSQNSPPVISGSPPNAVLIGDNYSFTPTASDAEGDTLTFRVSGLPEWAEFDSTTGTISGQPTLANVGTFSNISVSVTDGSDSASLPNFDITVTQTALGTMTLSWEAPFENTDGSSLTDLAGYNIYYGDSSGVYPNHVRIDNPSISTYVVDNLVPKTYFIVATAFNTSGVESTYSNEAVMTVATP